MAQLSWTPALFAQAEDRVHRIGCTHDVSIYYLLATDAFDMEIMRMLKRKEEVISRMAPPPSSKRAKEESEKESEEEESGEDTSSSEEEEEKEEESETESEEEEEEEEVLKNIEEKVSPCAGCKSEVTSVNANGFCVDCAY